MSPRNLCVLSSVLLFNFFTFLFCQIIFVSHHETERLSKEGDLWFLAVSIMIMPRANKHHGTFTLFRILHENYWCPPHNVIAQYFSTSLAFNFKFLSMTSFIFFQLAPTFRWSRVPLLGNCSYNLSRSIAVAGTGVLHCAVGCAHKALRDKFRSM